MPVTIKEIAALANVSRGTVDKVLNNRPGVKDSTREKVLKIAAELHYQPNFIEKPSSTAIIRLKSVLFLLQIITRLYWSFSREFRLRRKNFLRLALK